jgi:hypothetical protein
LGHKVSFSNGATEEKRAAARRQQSDAIRHFDSVVKRQL